MTVEVISSMTSGVLLSDLRLLAYAVDLGSFASVARAMHLPKTSVTRQIQRLEAAAGYRLLHRGNGNFSLTEEGRELLSKVRGPFNAIDEAMVELTTNTGLLQGKLRVAAPCNYRSHGDRSDAGIVHDVASGDRSMRCMSRVAVNPKRFVRSSITSSRIRLNSCLFSTDAVGPDR